MSSSLVLSMLSSRSIIRAAADHLDIYIYACLSPSRPLDIHTYMFACRIFAWMGRWIERQFDRNETFVDAHLSFLSIHQSISRIQYWNNEVTKQTRYAMKCITKGTHLHLKHST
jgi:hypothetical protein